MTLSTLIVPDQNKKKNMIVESTHKKKKKTLTVDHTTAPVAPSPAVDAVELCPPLNYCHDVISIYTLRYIIPKKNTKN